MTARFSTTAPKLSMTRQFDASGATTTPSNPAALPHWMDAIVAVFRHAAAPEHLAAAVIGRMPLAAGFQ